MEERPSISSDLSKNSPGIQRIFRKWVEMCLLAFGSYLLIAIPTLFFGATLSVWPAAGVAFASGYLLGFPGAVGIFFGTLAVNCTWAVLHNQIIGLGVIWQAEMAIGNALGALMSALILRKLLRGQKLFGTPLNGLLFCSTGAGTYAIVTAGLTALAQSSAGQSTDFIDLFLRDYVGVLIVAPLLILLVRRGGLPLLANKRGEVLVLTLLALFLTTLLFGPGYEALHPTLRLGVVLLVPLFWVANRFDLRVSTGLTLLCFLLVLKGTAMGYGVWGQLPKDAHAIMRVQVFFGAISIVQLITGISAEYRKKAEEELRLAYENTRQLVDSANVLIIGMNQERELKVFNHTAEKVTGYLLSELSGTDWFKTICPDEGCKEAQQIFQEFCETGRLSSEFETVIRTKAGTNRVISWQSNANLQGNGEVTMICYGMDITERRQGEVALKKSAEQIQDLYDKAPCGYHSIDPTGHIIRINQTELDWLGYTREEVLGKHITDLMIPASRGQFKYNFPKLKNERELRNLEVDFQCKDGRVLPVALSSTGIYDERDNFIMSRSTIYDLTERRKTEAKLRETRNFLDSIIDNIPNMLFVKESEGLRFVRLNNAGEELLGVTRNQIIGKDVFDLYPKEQAEFFTAKDREVLASGKLVDIPQEQVQTPKGLRIMHTKKIPISDETGKIQYLLGISEDITEVNRAQEELNRFFNLSVNLFCIAGVDGYFKRLNPAWESLLGYTREELMSRPLTDFIHPDDLEATHREAANLAQGKELISFENRYRCKNGGYRWLLWQARAVTSEGIIYAAAHDCTERKLAEETLKATTEDLKRSNEELEQFAYVASHDLQEPLRMVGSYTMLLGQRYKGQLDSEADKFIDYAVNGSKRMQMLIQDLLTYSRVGTKGRPFERVEMEETLKHVLEALRIAAEEAGAVITHDPLPEVIGEPIQMAQVLQNLIGNAIKFHGDEPPQVHISAKHRAGEWVFSVSDNGIGISPEYFERIFAIFQRLHARSRYEGTGIGLAVCKKIVQRHGGRIWVEPRVPSGEARGKSDSGSGAVFYFTIPDKPNNGW